MNVQHFGVLSTVNKHKLLTGIIILLIINIIVYRFTKADVESVKITPAQELQQNTQQIEQIEQINKLTRFKDALWAEADARRFMAPQIPFIAIKALELADRYKDDGLSIPILMGVIETESSFNPKAISRAKDGITPVAYGLMQIVRGTATPILNDMGYTWAINTILQPELNMEVGVTHLITLHRQFVALGIERINEFHISLIAYNRGEKVVLESVDIRKRASVSLEYLGKVKMVSRKWEKNGF